MDRFMLTTNSITGATTRDPNGDRAIGYYDQTDLPYYYELASQFATSDRWFSPVLTQTIPNRMYLFAGTSFGHILNRDPWPTTGWPQKTIFDELDAAGISWRYYYIDSSVFLSQWNTWQRDSNKVYNINNASSGWFALLSQPNADQMLPQVIFIERGSVSGLDEHPDANIQSGAAETANIINALLKSTAWPDSVFIFSFDEGGGLYDHVAPFSEPSPDGIPPMIAAAQAQSPGSHYVCGDFTESGFRVPMVVISPWVKPQFVSHVSRDNTAILKFIETWAQANNFTLPPLTARDAAQDNMLEFFDFTSPHLLNPPPLPTQPVCQPNSSNPPPCDDPRLESFP
jgi:phospholipase C